MVRERGCRLARAWAVALAVCAVAVGGLAGSASARRVPPSSTQSAPPSTQPTAPSAATCRAAGTQLRGFMANVTSSNASSYQTRDSTGYTTDTIKIVQIPQGYLGVYHDLIGTSFSVRLGFSTDLLRWRYVTTIATGASQPTIFPLPDGGFLVAYEKDDPGGFAHLEFRGYPSVVALGYNQYDAQFDAPRTLSPIGEGTPNVRSVAYQGSLSRSTIQVGFHYFDRRLGRDREGLGTLTNFSVWSTRVNTQLNTAFQPMPGGEIGGRDYLLFEGCPFTVIEAQSVLGDWSTWHVYLYDETAHTVTAIPVRTAGLSTSMGNHKFEIVTDPAGHQALVVSYFIFSQGSAPGEAGPLVFYTEF